MSLYETLGIEKNATPKEVRAAYRRKAKAVHPDAGGSTAAFQSVSLAHRILSDDEKRKQYDNTGRVDDNADAAQASALQIIHQAVMTLVSDPNCIYRDLVAEMKRSITGSIQNLKNQQTMTNKQIDKAEDVRKRFKVKRGQDFISQMLGNEINNARKVSAQMETQIAASELALTILSDASFTPEARPVQTMQTTTNIYTNLTGNFFR